MFDKLPFFRSTKKRWEEAQESAESVVRNSQSLRPPRPRPQQPSNYVEPSGEVGKFDVKVTAIPQKPNSPFNWKIRTEVFYNGQLEHVDEAFATTEEGGTKHAEEVAVKYVSKRKRFLAGETVKTFRL